MKKTLRFVDFKIRENIWWTRYIDCKESEEDYISCVSWVTEGNYLAVGDSNGTVDLWDVQSAKLMRSMTGMAIPVVEFSRGGYTKLDRFLHKNQHTQRKLLNLENWINRKVAKNARIWLLKSIFYVKNQPIFFIFFSLKNINLGDHSL